MMRITCRTGILLAMLTVFGWTARADDDNGTNASSASVDRLQQMIDKRRDVELEMHKLRLELIKTDPDINRLHEKIMAMHKELQIKIDANPMMQQLIKKSEQLDREIKKSTADKK